MTKAARNCISVPWPAEKATVAGCVEFWKAAANDAKMRSGTSDRGSGILSANDIG